MGCAHSKLVVFVGAGLIALAAGAAFAATDDLGNGFFHHGVATPVSNRRGTVATVDGEGRNVVLVWLFDHRGGYALLMLDAETGDSEQIPMPFPPGGALAGQELPEVVIIPERPQQVPEQFSTSDFRPGRTSSSPVAEKRYVLRVVAPDGQ